MLARSTRTGCSSHRQPDTPTKRHPVTSTSYCRGLRTCGAASAVLFALLLHLPLALANEIQTKFIAQESACTGGLNTITITMQVFFDALWQSKVGPSTLSHFFLDMHELDPPAGCQQALSLVRRPETCRRREIGAAGVETGGNWTARLDPKCPLCNTTCGSKRSIFTCLNLPQIPAHSP